MNYKLSSRLLSAAIVLSSIGLIAFRSDILGISLLHLEQVPSKEITESGPKLNPLEEALLNPKKFTPLPPEKIDVETLWLARAIFSESKRLDEQALVAWVVRNRVDTSYRGKRSYQSVILDPHQFSAFSPSSQKKSFYTGLNAKSDEPGWQSALHIAYAVRHAEGSLRPFSKETRHFYSERSLGDNLAPDWAVGLHPVQIKYESVDLDHWRFRFFEGVS